MGIKKVIERGRISKYLSGEDVSFGDVIIILSCERFSLRLRVCLFFIKYNLDVLF